jgi:hypothetical protein
VFALGDNEKVCFLRSLVAAGLILTGINRPGRQHACSRGESRQDQRAPCWIPTRRHRRIELGAAAFNRWCRAAIGFGHGVNWKVQLGQMKAADFLFLVFVLGDAPSIRA